MKKSLGVKPYLFPMPVLMISTYSEGDRVNVMNMAWGGICGENMVFFNGDAAQRTPLCDALRTKQHPLPPGRFNGRSVVRFYS